jgi:aspartate aminotransferase
MTGRPVSVRAQSLGKTPILRFFTSSTWAKRFGEEGICDFTIGNPHDMPSPAFVETLQRWVPPRNKHWYAYKTNENESREVVARSLQKWRGIAFQAEDIFLTNGAIAALMVVLNAVLDPGDEVIFISPPWPQYEGMIANAGGVPVRVHADRETFDLNMVALSEAISFKTRAVIINSPHNPSGKIYPPETLTALAQVLDETSRRNERTVYIISDEAYSRIVFDGRYYYSPIAFYSASFLVYTYGKVLLTPGQRIGYVAVPPDMPDREVVKAALLPVQMFSGWAFPNALLQHALGDLEKIAIDIDDLQSKRDLIIEALSGMGYEMIVPEGTFYVLVRSPWADDEAFIELLAEHNVFCLPGSVMELPGYFRICVTAGHETIRRSLEGFEKALAMASDESSRLLGKHIS